MAVDRAQFTEVIDKGLKANKDFSKFYINFKQGGIGKQKVLDYSLKQWDKRTRISNAKSELLNQKKKELNTGVDFTENSLLNNVADIYFKIACDSTQWTKDRKATYELYCRNDIGEKRLRDIRQVHIDALRKSMEQKGHSKQTANGCSPRTIKRVLIQVIKPILVYARENKVLNDIPNIKAPQQQRQKKIAENAGDKLVILFKNILSLYSNNPFYRALFLFALYGRRWNEIRTLQWSDIDILSNRYTINSKNNKIGVDQVYELPNHIALALAEIKDNHRGLVFKSPVTGKELYPPKKQLAKLKEKVDIPELTMHFFRHILVSAMGEAGTATTILSASLGHVNLDTVNQFYLSANHQKASLQTNNTIETMLKEHN